MGGIKLIKFAFKNRISTFVLENNTNEILLETFLKQSKSKILHLIKNLLDEYNALKITFEVFFLRQK